MSGGGLGPLTFVGVHGTVKGLFVSLLRALRYCVSST